jgi:hypothetical protein
MRQMSQASTSFTPGGSVAVGLIFDRDYEFNFILEEIELVLARA